MGNSKVRESGHGADSKGEAKSCDDHEVVPSKAVDLLVEWIKEDVHLVAEAFAVDVEQLLAMQSKPLRSGAAATGRAKGKGKGKGSRNKRVRG